MPRVDTHRHTSAEPAAPVTPCPLYGVVRWLRLVALVSGAILAIAGGTNAEEQKARDSDFSLISPDEPYASEFSLSKAHAYLEDASTRWSSSHRCITCHTNGLYLLSGRVGSRPLLETQQFAREYLKRYVVDGEQPSGQHGAIEGIVATTALLTISEGRTGSKLHPMTRRALDYIWTQQGDDGCWDHWLKSNWPPYEVDDHFGVTLAVLALAMAPDEYAQTPAAQQALERLLRYLADHPPNTMHQKAMLLWASTVGEAIMTVAEREKVIDELFALQRSDGGWNIVTLGPLKGSPHADPAVWVRSDGTPQDAETSDGYATGFVVYVLRQAGIAADEPRLQKAIAWLKSHQRASGRWFTRSPRRDTRHLISNAGTSFAALALEACQ